VWYLGASPSPPGSLWQWWVRAWTESGPMMSLELIQLCPLAGCPSRLPQAPAVPYPLGPLFHRLPDWTQ
jgi:hypothetical protein